MSEKQPCSFSINESFAFANHNNPITQPRWEWVFLCCRQKFPTQQINNNMLEHQLSFVKPSFMATTIKRSANLQL